MNKQSYHYHIDLTTNQLGSFYVPISANSVVKKIGFNFAYNISADDLTSYIITCENVNNEVVGLLNQFARSSGGVIYCNDGLSTENEIVSYFDKPLNGNLKFNYKQDINNVTVATCKILVLINLYY